MRETSKSAMRRWREGAFQSRYFVGRGIDIGAGDDSLGQFVGVFPKMEHVRPWDIGDGDAQYMAGVADESLDFVHSSHCLEHMRNPREALWHWLRILRPGGYLIVTVPDEDLYEGGHWPSRYNSDHKWCFTINRFQPRHEQSINVIDLVREFGGDIECESVRLIRDGYRDELGDCDQTLGAAECAIEWVWRKRIRRAPALLREGWDLAAAGNDEGAERAYQAAIEDSPDWLEAYNLLALLYNSQNQGDKSVQVWERCVEAMPNLHAARLYQALHYQSVKRYDLGFSLRDPLVSDARRTPFPPPTNYPRWRGESLNGRSIVIWTEFGLGDEIMFARFANVFKEQMGASSVSLVCQAPLVPLLQTIRGADSVVAREVAHELPHHDFWVFGHSIPAYYSLDTHGVPAVIPYVANPYAGDGAAKPRSVAAPGSRGLKVGLVWRGDPTHENDAHRSLHDLNVLEPLFRLPGIHWVCLQAGGAQEEMAIYSRWAGQVSDAGASMRDFADSARAVDALDLVITVDTSMVHLAGAMGKPTWLLLPSLCDWRWGISGDESDWYPSVKVFRQRQIEQWVDVIQRVAAALQARSIEQQTGEAETRHHFS
jgi:SAM-dependent methyltransferase